MSDFYGKEKDIVVLKQTPPGMCGGTDATLDRNAPNKIISEDMLRFDVTSALHTIVDDRPVKNRRLYYVSAFAAHSGSNTFVFLSYSDDKMEWRTRKSEWKLLEDNIFPDLVKLVNECDLARNNGFHSVTHGLPEDFGGRINIEYAGGENISISNNQSPLFSLDTAEKIVTLFTEKMRGATVKLPDLAKLSEIRFDEERKDGGFKHAVLKLLPDGSGIVSKKSKYEDPKVYESEKPVDAETISKIISNIENNGMLAWQDISCRDTVFNENKSLTFVFEDGNEVVVKNNHDLPYSISGAFFNIELEMNH